MRLPRKQTSMMWKEPLSSPHPGPLPGGEGTATFSEWALALAPLPQGEGLG